MELLLSREREFGGPRTSNASFHGSNAHDASRTGVLFGSEWDDGRDNDRQDEPLVIRADPSNKMSCDLCFPHLQACPVWSPD